MYLVSWRTTVNLLPLRCCFTRWQGQGEDWGEDAFLVPPAVLAPPAPTLLLQHAPGLPLFLEAIFSASRGVLKSTGSLAGLWPWMEMACTCTMYSVSSSRSQRAQERVVVFTSWMKRSIRTSFFCKSEHGHLSVPRHQPCFCLPPSNDKCYT